MSPTKKRGPRTKCKTNQQRQRKKDPKPNHDAKTSGSGTKTMRRSRKRKNDSTKEAKEIQIPSSAVLPARLLSEVSQRISQSTLPVIKKEIDSVPIIKMPKTDSIPLDTDKTFVNTDVDDIQNVTSKCQKFPAVFEPMPQTTDGASTGTNNKLSFSNDSCNVQNVKSEPVSPVASAANSVFEDSNYCEQNVQNLNLIKIKCEPRSRSSSTETILNEESLQLPLTEGQSDISTKSSSAICQVTNVAHSSLGAGENSVLPLNKESLYPPFVAPIQSPNITFSQHRNSAIQKLTSNIPFVTKLFKYNNFNADIAKADAKDCLNYLTSTYPSNRSFSLFCSNDTYLTLWESPAEEPAESIPTVSSTPTVTEVISTDELKKIIEITSSLPSSNLPLPLQNSENNNIVKDTKNVNTLSVSGSVSQLPIVCSTIEKESDHTLDPNIRIKNEPIDDYDTSSVISPSVSTSGKRSAEESSIEMHGLPKKIKISSGHSLSATEYTIETQIKLGDDTEKCDSIDTSKGSIQNQSLENAHIISNTLKSVALTPPNSCSDKNTVSDNMLPNNANMSHVSSISDSKNSRATNAILSKSATSKFSSYLHLLPPEIHKGVSSTDKAPDTIQRTILSVEPSTSVSSNYTVVTTVSDSVITKNNINYGQKIPVINRLSTCSAMQHVEKANLGDDRNPSDIYNPFACNKINTLNAAEPGIISSNSVTTKKKISPELYFRRKSSLHSHDPCTQNYIGQNSVSQISSPDNSVEPFIASIASLANQQNPNRTPIAYSKNAHQFHKSTSSPRLSLNVQQKSFQNSASSQSISMATPTEISQRSVTSSNQTQVLAENSNVSHQSSRRSGEFLPSTSRDPRKSHSKSYYQKLFGSPRQDFSSIFTLDSAGNKFIKTKHLPYIILSWNVSWLSIQKETFMNPPIWDNYLSVKDTYQCVQQYYDTYQPLHLLNVWFDIYQGWEKSKVTYNGALIQVKREEDYIKIACTVKLTGTDSYRPKKEDILICTSSSAGSTQKFFGRIVNLVERNWNPSPDLFHFEKPGVYKQMYVEITCTECFTVLPPAVVQLQYLTNIGIALKQNDAIKNTNPVMLSMVLNPSGNEQLLQTTTVPPVKNIAGVMHSVRFLEHRVTIINTSTASTSVTTILQVALLLKTDLILLVGVKDQETFLDLAFQMKNLNLVLAIRGDEVPPELRGLTVNYCDFATLKSCRVVLTLIPSMFFGEIESRLKTESIICIIHEAQYFFETETALLLAYKVEHLILTGRPDKKASTPPKLARYSFDVSLFHRILRKR